MDHPDALFNLGTLHFNGIEGVLESNEENSLPFFEKAASLGDEASLYWVGHCYLSGEGGVTTRNSQQAITYLQSAAEKGYERTLPSRSSIAMAWMPSLPTRSSSSPTSPGPWREAIPMPFSAWQSA